MGCYTAKESVHTLLLSVQSFKDQSNMMSPSTTSHHIMQPFRVRQRRMRHPNLMQKSVDWSKGKVCRKDTFVIIKFMCLLQMFASTNSQFWGENNVGHVYCQWVIQSFVSVFQVPIHIYTPIIITPTDQEKQSLAWAFLHTPNDFWEGPLSQTQILASAFKPGHGMCIGVQATSQVTLGNDCNQDISGK